MRITFLLAIAIFPLSASAADIYKCQTAAGKVEFQDRPCDAKAKAEKLDVQPNTVGHQDLTEIRAKAAALKAKQQARTDAENKAAADRYAAQEKGEAAVQPPPNVPAATTSSPKTPPTKPAR